MRRILLFFSIVLNLSSNTFSQTPDWSTQIASIIYSNCSSCHHEGGIAPFALMSYEDAAENAFGIQIAVNSLQMPPWPPDPNFTHFRDEKVLSASDLEAINLWIDGGVPSGDLNYAPLPPVYTGLSVMQQIDDTVHMPEYTVTLPEDDFRTFVVSSDYTEVKYVNQIEVIPGDYSMVHHLFIWQDPSDFSFVNDTLSPGPGFPSGSTGVYSPYAQLIGGWTPGSELFSLPSNMGMTVSPGADYVVAFHYAPNSQGKTDSTKINLKFAEGTDIREVSVPRYLHWHPPSLVNPPFVIPANTVKTFYEQSEVFTQPKSLLALQPHCHLIGKSWKVYMVTAPGDTTNLISIPNWSFDWQMCYFLTQVMEIPVGAQLFAEAVFDNTSNNPNNPSNPPKPVVAGETSFHEMMSVRFWVLDYQEGDEDIVLDSSYFTGSVATSLKDALPLKISPNPASDKIYFVASLPEHEISWELINSFGQIVKTGRNVAIPKGMYTEEINASGLSSGSYFLSVTSGDKQVTAKVVIVR